VRERRRLVGSGVVPVVYETAGYNYIGYNCESPKFSDPRVRRALSRLVDRKKIIEQVYLGYADPVQSPVFRKRPEYDTTLGTLGFDPAEAGRLLAEAGWTDSDGDGVRDREIDGRRVPLRFTLLYPTQSTTGGGIAGIVSAEARKAGVEIRLEASDWSLFLSRARTGLYEAYIAGWGMSAEEGDPRQLWHSESIGGGSNYVRFRHPEVDRLIEALESEFDADARLDLWRRLQRVIYYEAPYTFLCSAQATGAYDRRFRNATWYATRRRFRVGTWWVPKSERKYPTAFH
jgi:peptide/nickel transport system substrate-binding protein